MSPYGRTALAIGGQGVIAGVVETLAFTVPKTFVPITWVIVDAGNVTALPMLALGILLGHFAPPRGPEWAKWATVVLVALAAAVQFTFYLPASGALAGYVSGSLFFLSGDRRKA